MKVKIFGKTVTIKDSNRKNKQKVAILPDGFKVHFGDPNMDEYPGTKRGDNYCSRSYGIAKKYDIEKEIRSPNFWSRWYLWNCNKDKSFKTRPKLTR